MSNPNNTSRLKTLIILVLVGFVGYMLYSNSVYESKLIRYSNQIARLQSKGIALLHNISKYWITTLFTYCQKLHIKTGSR